VGGAFQNGSIIPPSRPNPTRGLNDKNGSKKCPSSYKTTVYYV